MYEKVVPVHKHHVMKSMWELGISTCVNSALDGVSSQIHVLTSLPPGKETLVQIG